MNGAIGGTELPPPPPYFSEGTTYYVSPSGNDNNPGTQALPKKTPQGGLDAVRSAKANLLPAPYTVQFAPGRYPMSQTLLFQPSDSGTFGQPTVFRGETNAVYFDGSRQVTGWQKVSGTVALRFSPAVRDKVFVANLPTNLDGSAMDTGSINRRGFPYSTSSTWSQLVFNDNKMTLSQYPNSGWLKVPANHGGSGTSIQLTDLVPYQWKNTGDVWVYGYLAHDWADSFERVWKFDRLMRRIVLSTVPNYGIKANQRYLLLNAMEAVDSAGEYYIDRVDKKVYFYPPLDGFTDAQKIAAMNAGTGLTSLDQTILETYDATDLRFENITFQNGRRNGALAKYGARVGFYGCTFRNLGMVAAQALSGTDHTFESCDFYNLDEGAVTLQGGNRTTLTPGNHLVNNCWIHDYSQLCRTYRPAVDVWGVGNTVSHSQIENAPHQGVVLHGNNHVVEYTNFDRLCMETSDAGAVYINRNVTQQGNKVWYNYFHDLKSRQVSFLSNFVVGVYMDDYASGTEVSSNLFEDVQRGIIVGGGRDNTIDLNEFHATETAVQFDARCTSWASNFWTAWNVPAMLAEVPYTGSLWRTAYPKLANYLSDGPALPKRNKLTNNVFYGSDSWLLLLDGLTLSDTMVGDPPIYAFNNTIIREREEPVGSRGGEGLIDRGLIGLVLNQWRTELP